MAPGARLGAYAVRSRIRNRNAGRGVFDMVIEVTGPPSKCPECLVDFLLEKAKCSGCGNTYEGWEMKEGDL